MGKESEVIRVMIVDDHEMVRSGLITFLQAFDELELIRAASNGKEALRICAEILPDVILMDMVMPEMDGLETTRQIKHKYPHVQIIALTSFFDDSMVQKALEAGVISYLHKDVSIDKLGEAIRNAYKGTATLSSEATKALISIATRPPKPGHDLTSRELGVLAQLVLGLSNPEIAEQLSISRSTVKTHVSSILRKLGVTSRLEAVTLAIEHKIITE